MRQKIIHVIGHGKIGSNIVAHIHSSPNLVLGRIFTRSGKPDTGNIEAFLADPADLIIEAAGPTALRETALECLAKCEVWSVGGAALADTGFYQEVDRISKQSGNALRLFAPWAYGIDTAPNASILSLKISMGRPGMKKWQGPLGEAAKLFPNEVNFAVSAAVTGPGIENTEIIFSPMDEKGIHQIKTECETEAGFIKSSIEFKKNGRHPTALSIIAALDKLNQNIHS